MTMKNFRVRRGLTIAGETTASTSIAAPNSGSDQSYTLPTAVPAVNGYVLASQTDGTMSWVANPDTNTTYDFNATTATGGANLNLVGSDATTDTVKLSNGGHITATYTSGTEVTLGSDATDANTASTIVARDASGNFSAGTGSFTGVQFNGATSGSVSIAAPATAGTQAYTLPTALPAVTGYVLSGTTGGALSWVDNATGVTSITGTADQVIASSSTGAVTLSLPQSIATTSNPTFAGATLDAVTVGIDSAQTISTTSGNLVLQTAAGVNSGTITINAGAAGNIAIAPDTTGDIHLNSDAIRIGDANATATLATRGTGNLVLTTNEGSGVEGTLTFTNGANGSATFAPNGTGNVATTFNNGGNLTNNRNYVFGAIRNATTAGIGDIWAFNATGTIGPLRGVSLDNSADTTKNVGTVLRGYSGSAASGQRGRLVFEKARNTVASPAANAAADVLGSIEATGYSSTGWVNDTIPATPGLAAFICNENWVSNTNLGTGFIMNLAPTATTISTTANLVQALNINPQTFASRSDAFTWAQGKTGTTQNMSLDVSGNLIVTGDVRVNGNDIQGSGGTTAISLTSANASTTVRGDFINLVNAGNTATNLQLGSTFANFASAGTNYAAMNTTSTTFTNSGLNTFIRQGTVNSVQPALTLRYQRSDTANPNDNDGVDFRLGVGGTSTNTNIARFDAVYKTSGLHQFGISVSTDSFAADSDNIYRGQADKTVIRATPAGTTGTAQDVVTIEQTDTVISTTPSTSVPATARLTVEGTAITASAPIQFPAYMAVAVNGLLASTGASGTGSVATLTFGVLPFGIQYSVGSTITVAGVSPAAYNGDVIVTACTTTSVSYVSTATGAQTVAGTIKLKAGQLGQQIAITDSFIGGRMAYWDTTNVRWSYIIDDSAV